MTEPDDLTREGLIRCFGPITDAMVSEAIDRILVHNLRQDVQTIRLWVNSPGGDVSQGFALLDIMRWSAIPIHTTGLGLVASMGLLVLMAGAKGQRTVMPSTSLLSHRFSQIAGGNHADLIAARQQQDLMHRRILDHYRSCTRLDRDELIENELLRATDRWLDPDQAVAFGIIDRVWSPQNAGLVHA